MRIDCHVHSNHSDGSDTILSLAYQALKLGHSALVITDHDNEYHPNPYGQYPTSYRSARNEIKALKEQIPLPVILGSEITTPFGECLLFGEKALVKWFYYRKHLEYVSKHFSKDAWVSLFEEHVLHAQMVSGAFYLSSSPLSYGLILCHPHCNIVAYNCVPTSFWKLCHGFETQEFLMPEITAVLRDCMPGARELTNSDAHSLNELGKCFNETPNEITTEEQLIFWLTENRPKRSKTR